MIAAIEKAEALARHRAYLGCSWDDFAVTLTEAEARELLEWFLATSGYDALFLRDLKKHRAEPFRAFELHDVRLVGFPIVRLQ